MKKILWLALAGVVLAGLILALGGAFQEKIDPGQGRVLSGDKEAGRTARARVEHVERVYEAVGTVRPKVEVRVEPRITARVEKVLVRPGEVVEKDALLVVLDDREFTARVEGSRQGLAGARSRKRQAEQAVTAAEAAREKMDATYARMARLYETRAISREEYELAAKNRIQAQAELQRARQGLEAARSQVAEAERGLEGMRISRGYTEIRAPEAGEVVKRLVEPGDMALAGRPLLVMQTGGKFWLEALVRESAIRAISPGQSLEVTISALDRKVEGVVEEIVPSADPRTRTFLVRVGLPDTLGLYQGMFGRLSLPMGRREAVLVPGEAVRRVGQLTTVTVQTEAGPQSFYVQLGPTRGDDVEVAAGLTGEETLILPGGGHE